MGCGRVRSTPADVDVMAQVVRSWFRSAWAPSRAVEERSVSVGLEERGLGSVQRRLPRSKV